MWGNKITPPARAHHDDGEVGQVVAVADYAAVPVPGVLAARRRPVAAAVLQAEVPEDAVGEADGVVPLLGGGREATRTSERTNKRTDERTNKLG